MNYCYYYSSLARRPGDLDQSRRKWILATNRRGCKIKPSITRVQQQAAVYYVCICFTEHAWWCKHAHHPIHLWTWHKDSIYLPINCHPLTFGAQSRYIDCWNVVCLAEKSFGFNRQAQEIYIKSYLLRSFFFFLWALGGNLKQSVHHQVSRANANPPILRPQSLPYYYSSWGAVLCYVYAAIGLLEVGHALLIVGRGHHRRPPFLLSIRISVKQQIGWSVYCCKIFRTHVFEVHSFLRSYLLGPYNTVTCTRRIRCHW